MILPVPNDKHVRVVFRNGTIIEGIVKEWVSNYVELRSLSDESIMIIAHPEEDIMLIKVLPDKPVKEPKSAVEEMADKIRAKAAEIVENPPQTEEQAELQQKSIAELKRMVTEQDRKMIRKRIRDHYPSAYQPRKAGYGNQIDMIPPGAVRRRNG